MNNPEHLSGGSGRHPELRFRRRRSGAIAEDGNKLSDDVYAAGSYSSAEDAVPVIREEGELPKYAYPRTGEAPDDWTMGRR